MCAEAVVSFLQSDGFLIVCLDDVNSWLILVHGVENELETKRERVTVIYNVEKSINEYRITVEEKRKNLQLSLLCNPSCSI